THNLKIPGEFQIYQTPVVGYVTKFQKIKIVIKKSIGAAHAPPFLYLSTFYNGLLFSLFFC
ncbi:hypothetical protein, partial [Pectobacterium versatile]|uniref:hypothetical protein n=1 Tax=Pectobacterium versatile TaxID=2488639 RepID=UPI001F24C176